VNCNDYVENKLYDGCECCINRLEAEYKELKAEIESLKLNKISADERIDLLATENEQYEAELETLKQPKKLEFEWEDTENKSILKINDNVKFRVVESLNSGIFVSLDIHILNQCGISPNILFRHCFDIDEAKQAAEQWLQGLVDGLTK
jgi:predicted nuclease with TOPRIM domain